jgi:hypothetical protein
MTRLALILAAVVCLSGCKSSEINSAIDNITGDTQPVALAAIEPSSSVGVSSVEPVVDCTPTLWRGMYTNPCTGETYPMD